MIAVRLTTSGRVTIPKELRSNLGVTAGDQATFAVTPERSVDMRFEKK